MIHFSAAESCDKANREEAAKAWHDMMGPQAVDLTVRQAIATCWMVLPQGRKSVEAVEAEIRRIVERALKDLREDAQAFGIPPGTPTGHDRPTQSS
jgi:hypothetical protein